MDSRKRLIRGRVRLRQLLDATNPTRFSRLIEQKSNFGSRIVLRVRSDDDRDIDAYLGYLGSQPIDQLPVEDRELVFRSLKKLGMAALLEWDTLLVGREPSTVLFNVSNNEFIPSPEVWYQASGYDDIRQNYARLAEIRAKAGVQKRFHRVELYRTSNAIERGPYYRFWLLLHLWEEAVVNGTEVILVDLDETSPTLSEALMNADFHLISASDGGRRLFQHSAEWQLFEEPDGTADSERVTSAIDLVLDDSLMRAGHRITPNELRALCFLWSDSIL